MDGGDKTETMGLVISNEWNGTYARHGPFFTHWEDCYIWAGVRVDLCIAMYIDMCVDMQWGDCYIWADARGTHMLGHSQHSDHLKPGTHQQRRGGYAFSADGLTRWDYSDWEVQSYTASNPLLLTACLSMHMHIT